MSVFPISFPPKKLSQSILSTDSSFIISNILHWDGINDLTPSDLGTVAYAIFTNDTRTKLEIMKIDPATVASASITVLSRGLDYSGGATSSADRKFDWTANETTIQLGTDFPQLFQYYKDYIDAIAIAGAPNATTVLQGLVELATQTEVDAGTSTGGTGASLTPTPDLIRAKKYHDYAADAGSTDSYAITITPAITTYTTGQEFTFKANTANTGAATLNVSGLGAKTIKKNYNEDLVTGDIIANQIVKVVYDGTNMQMLSNIAQVTPVVRTYLNAGSPATWTKPSGLKYVVVECVGGGGGGGGADAQTGETTAGAGGGAGAYSKKTIAAATLGATETVTTGAGGTAGADTGGDGGTGGTSSFGSHCSSTGGVGGFGDVNANSVSTYAAGGTASGGDLNISGGIGQPANTGSTSSAKSEGSPGAGGASFFGGSSSVATTGPYGAGAYGAYSSHNGTAGGAGGNGIVIVTEYYS